ncbi:MAG TPA: PPOX class F420-dependent oxidoreductase [Ktedonobacteraceae bacterium]|nr:PPOX class F420-dependent oxidoreductase [Ktedonobacteraceae bacterium]
MAAQLSTKARAYLNEHRFAVLATYNEDGTVQQTVMWYLLEGDTIVMNTKKGRKKYNNLLRNPRISVCVPNGYIYLTLSGTVELIDDPQTAQHDIYRLALLNHGEMEAQEQMRQQFSKEQRVTIRMKIDHTIEDL